MKRSSIRPLYRDEWVSKVNPDGIAFARSTRGVSKTLAALWRRNPSMVAPDRPGNRYPSRTIELDEL